MFLVEGEWLGTPSCQIEGKRGDAWRWERWHWQRWNERCGGSFEALVVLFWRGLSGSFLLGWSSSWPLKSHTLIFRSLGLSLLLRARLRLLRCVPQHVLLLLLVLHVPVQVEIMSALCVAACASCVCQCGLLSQFSLSLLMLKKLLSVPIRVLCHTVARTRRCVRACAPASVRVPV